MTNRVIFLTALAIGLTVSSSRADLTINLNFSNANSPDANLFGSGNFMDINRAAADYWESAFRGSSLDITHTIDIGWTALGGSTLAQGGTGWFGDGRLVGGNINYDNDGSTNWYVDGSPFDSSEWSTLNEYTADLGGGDVNVGREYSGASGDASGRADMLSVAIHEMGHALGVLSIYPRFVTARDADGDSSDLDITGALPFAGSEIPVTGGHINTYSRSSLYPSITTGRRKLLSGIDILLVGQMHGFDSINLNPSPVPEPGAVAIVGAALVGVCLLRRRQGRMLRA